MKGFKACCSFAQLGYVLNNSSLCQWNLPTLAYEFSAFRPQKLRFNPKPRIENPVFFKISR